MNHEAERSGDEGERGKARPLTSAALLAIFKDQAVA